MKSAMKNVVTIMVLLMLATPYVGIGQESRDSAQQEKLIRNQLERWRQLWSQTGMGKRFSLDGYEDLYVADTAGKPLLTFDSYVPKWATTQIDGFSDYRQVWEKDVNESFPNWTIVRMDILRVGVSERGGMAWSAVNFWGQGRRGDGTEYEGSQHGTHVWRYVDDQWRIAHEHLTAPIVVRGKANAKIDNEDDTAPKPGEILPTRNTEAFGIQSIDHVAISTVDFERSVKWYSQILDFRKEVEWEAPNVVPGMRLAYLVHPSGTRLEIVGGNNIVRTSEPATDIPSSFAVVGFSHVCLGVTNIDDLIEDAEKRGAKVVAQPFDFPKLKKRLAFLQDPDGNMVEFVQPMRN